MTTIATLVVKLIGDIAGYTTAMTQAEQKSKKTAAEIGKNFQKVGSNLTSLGQKATLGLTLPIVALGATAIKAASDLDETKNKVNVVFGDMSKSVLDWSMTSATALGQSREQALAAAATYGNLFVSLGLGQKPAAEMSTSLVGLASDLASFNNADPSEVLLALRSGLSGEIEPLKKFGIAMNETILKQKAMTMGFGDNIQALTESQKLQLRYAIIMEQTATAQGDFARTSGGLANQQRILKAQFTDAAAALGTQLLPLALKFVTFLTGLIEKFSHLSPGMQKFVLIILGIAAAAGPVLMVIGSIASGIGAIIPLISTLGPALAAVGAFITGTAIPAIASLVAALAPVAIPILAIIAVLALLYLAWKNNWGGIQEKTAAAWEWLKGAFSNGVAFIKNIWMSLQPAIQFVLTFINTIVRAWQAAFNGDWYRFGQLLRQAWDMVWNLITTILQTAWQNIKNIISNAVTNVINFFRNTDWGKVGRNIIDGIADGIRNGVGRIIDAARDAARAALDAAKGFLGISSPSKLFEMQVGYQMAAGTAGGFREGLAKLLQPSFGLLTPAFTATTSTVPAIGGGGSVGAFGQTGDDRVIELLEQILDNVERSKVARTLRDAMLQRQG
jgi:hypothetical protein